MEDKTKQKIQELVPEIKKRQETASELWDFLNEKGDSVWGRIGGSELWRFGRDLFECPITLADVLSAIHKKNLGQPYFKIGAIAKNGCLIIGESYWDLTKPYDDQSQETKDFIGSILQANK